MNIKTKIYINSKANISVSMELICSSNSLLFSIKANFLKLANKLALLKLTHLSTETIKI